jgi:hypothetical protein
MFSICCTLLLLLSKTILVASRSRPSGSASTALHISIINASGGLVGISWINPKQHEEDMYLGEVPVGTSVPMDSYRGHEFQLRELPERDTGVCQSKDQTCRVAFFSVRPGEEQNYSVNANFEMEYTDLLQPDPDPELQDAPDVISYCKEKAKKGLESETSDSKVVMQHFHSCLTTGLSSKLKEADDEVQFMSQLRDGIAAVSQLVVSVIPNRMRVREQLLMLVFVYDF